MVGSLRTESRIDLAGISTGAVTEIEIMSESVAGGSGSMNKHEPERLFIANRAYGQRDFLK